MRYWLIFGSITLAACTANKPAEKPVVVEQELITRQSEPLVKQPIRMSAEAFEVSEAVETRIQDLLSVASPSTEVVSLTGLKWSDAQRSVFVSHVHFPPHDMAEADFAEAVDERALDRCDEEFSDCADGGENCDYTAYETCIASAYRDRFVYMSSHQGIDCGVLELSVFSLNADQPTLEERRVLDPMVCEFTEQAAQPAGTDLDGDGGPELAYTWESSDTVDWGGADVSTRIAVTVLDANDLTEQFRWTQSEYRDNAAEVHSFYGLNRVERPDGFADLRTNYVRTEGFCVGYGWALGPDFVRPVDADTTEDVCSLEATQAMHTYDPQTDTWVGEPPAPPAKPEPTEPTSEGD